MSTCSSASPSFSCRVRLGRILAASAFFPAAFLSPLRAYDEPPVNLGFTSFLDGGPPAGPGFYFQQYLQYYHSSDFRDAAGGSLFPSDPDLDVWVSLSQLIYQSDQELLLGGKWGLDLILPVVSFDLESNPFGLSDNSGIGDVLVGPYLQWDPIMGSDGPLFMHRIELQTILPSGSYNKNDALNPSSNHSSFNPYWAGTLFLQPRWTASWRTHLLFNGENDALDLRPGRVFHANFATAYELIPGKLRVGINGYLLKQISDSEVHGNSVSGKEQVFGIGPGLLHSFSKEDHLFANLYWETDARNRPSGTRLTLRWTHHF